MSKRFLSIIFVAVAFVVTCAAIATGSYFSAGLNLTVGTVSDTRVRAPRDIEDVQATERNRNAAREIAENLALIYAPDPAQLEISQHNINALYYDIQHIRETYAAERATFYIEHYAWVEQRNMLETEANIARNLWEREREHAILHNLSIPEEPAYEEIPPEPVWELWAGEAYALFDVTTYRFNETQQQLILSMSDESFYEFWDAVSSVAYTVQGSEIIPEAIGVSTQLTVRHEVLAHELGTSASDLAEQIIIWSLRANGIPNEEENYQRMLDAMENYAVEMIYEDTIILDEGDLILPEVYELLDRLGMLAPESIFDNIYPILGVFFLTLVLFVICVLYIAHYHPSIAGNVKECSLLLTLYLLTIILVWTFSDFAFTFLPILIFPMLVSILIDRRSSTVLTVSLVFISYFIVEGDLMFLLFFSVSGVLISLLSRYTTERGKIILVGLVAFVMQFALAFALTLVIDMTFLSSDMTPTLFMASFAGLNGLLTVILSMGSLPFWETIFGVVTPIKLLDLTNPTNLLLRRLTIEAPGTYHHSLIVANLAETAAYDIGANPQAARVGGYYHDVGKLKFPHNFIENLDGEDNPHNYLDPINSTQLIMSHVSYGLTLAGEHRLPQFVRDIIKEHHGTTLMQYFYNKAKESGSELSEDDFRYPYIIPQTKESACVMLADSVEAAVRSMVPKMKSLADVEKAIRNIIRGKLNDGQLADSQLSIKDVTIIEQSFFRVLKGMYHERIEYSKTTPEAAAPTRIPVAGRA